MIDSKEQEEELEKCCPLCGGKISSILEQFSELESYYTQLNHSWNAGKARDFDSKVRFLELKLKMIEMGVIPK